MITLANPLDTRYAPPNDLAAIASTLAAPFYITPPAGVAIRDTANHDPSTDAANFILVDCRQFSGPKLLYVNNQTDQTATVTMLASFTGLTSDMQSQGAGQSVNTLTKNWTTFSTLANLQHAYPYVSFRVAFTVQPTSGLITVGVVLRSQ